MFLRLDIETGFETDFETGIETDFETGRVYLGGLGGSLRLVKQRRVIMYHIVK